jgi:hypothetical protein
MVDENDRTASELVAAGRLSVGSQLANTVISEGCRKLPRRLSPQFDNDAAGPRIRMLRGGSSGRRSGWNSVTGP